MAEAATRRAEDKKTRREEGKLTISANPAGDLVEHCCPGYIEAGCAPIYELATDGHHAEDSYVRSRGFEDRRELRTGQRRWSASRPQLGDREYF